MHSDVRQRLRRRDEVPIVTHLQSLISPTRPIQCESDNGGPDSARTAPRRHFRHWHRLVPHKPSRCGTEPGSSHHLEITRGPRTLPHSPPACWGDGLSKDHRLEAEPGYYARDPTQLSHCTMDSVTCTMDPAQGKLSGKGGRFGVSPGFKSHITLRLSAGADTAIGRRGGFNNGNPWRRSPSWRPEAREGGVCI